MSPCKCAAVVGLWVGLSAGCGGDGVGAGAGRVVAEPIDEAAHIYDPGVVHTFEVEIDPAELARVDADPRAEMYVPARLRFEGVSYDVGYRYKGSVGAFRPPCTLTRGGGPRLGKCSIKLSFNWPDPEGRFFGLKKLQFHAMNNDPSMLRERLGYSLFREMGVPAPRATHAILRVNGQADVYALVEQVDGRFTRTRFSEGGEGNLYKEIWPIHDDPSAYLAALETNEDEQPSVDRMLRFKDAALSGPSAMARWLDRSLTLRYLAVDRVLLNDDGIFHMYCVAGGYGNNPGPPGNHNYYWYEAEAADRLWLIPWDLDLILGDAASPIHLSTDWRSIPSESECSRACSGRLGGYGGPPAACDPVFRNFQAWLGQYEKQVDAFIAGPFNSTAVNTKLTHWTAQLERAGYPPPEAAVEALKTIIDDTRKNRGL